MKKFFAFAIMFYACYMHSQQSFIEGRVFDAKTRQPLYGAQVYTLETKRGTTTDVDGKFKIPWEGEKVHVVFSYLGYMPDTILMTNVQPLTVYLQEKTTSLKTVSVVGMKNRTTELAAIEEIKKSEASLTSISQEIIQKNKDKNAAQAIRRLPGILLHENKYVFIRGIPDRYNVTLLNEALAPSFESDKQVFSLDILPSSIIEKITVYKSANAEMPGNFSGGLVMIDTKQHIDSPFVSTTLSLQTNSQTTFQLFQSTTTSFVEKLGFASDEKKLPKNFPASINQLSLDRNFYWAKQLPNTWLTQQEIASPNYSMEMSMGKKTKFLNRQWSFISSISYGSQKNNRTNSIFNYNMYDLHQQKSDTIYAYNDHVYREQHQLMVMQNVTSSSTSSFLSYKGFFIQQNESEYTFREGKNIEEGYHIRAHGFKYTERTLTHHTLKLNYQQDKYQLEGLSYLTFSLYNQPDYKRVRTAKSLDAEEDAPYIIILAPSASVLDAGRMFQQMHEVSTGAKCSYQQKLERITLAQTSIKSGVGFDYTAREFNVRWFSYTMANSSSFDQQLLYLPISEAFSPANFHHNGFKLQEGTNPSDHYSASMPHAYAFLNGNMKFDRLSLVSGFRFQALQQNLLSRTYTNEPVDVQHTYMHLLPSASMKWNYSTNSQFKMNYYMSVNYPTFRELAPYSYYDFTSNSVILGNPSLKNATIHNIDFRWEQFPGLGNLISLGLFYQYLKQPIEMYFVPGTGSGGTRNFTFNHAEHAQNMGLESELNVKIKSFQGSRIQTLQIISNTALVHSEVELNKTLAAGQNHKRPLMGQANFLFNTGVYLQTKNFGVNVLYNYVGKRLYAAGTYGTPDVYEMPRHSLESNLQYRIFKKLFVYINVQNMLNKPFYYKQDSNMNGKIDKNDELLQTYKTGISCRFELNYRF